MRTVGALRDAQRENRRQRKEKILELMQLPGMDLRNADEMAGEQFDAEWRRLEGQIALNKVPGNRK